MEGKKKNQLEQKGNYYYYCLNMGYYNKLIIFFLSVRETRRCVYEYSVGKNDKLVLVVKRKIYKSKQPPKTSTYSDHNQKSPISVSNHFFFLRKMRCSSFTIESSCVE